MVGRRLPRSSAVALERCSMVVRDQLSRASTGDALTLAAFEVLPPSHRTEYARWMAEAAREGTRQR